MKLTVARSESNLEGWLVLDCLVGWDSRALRRLAHAYFRRVSENARGWNGVCLILKFDSLSLEG